jgi:hypothetical protein
VAIQTFSRGFHLPPIPIGVTNGPGLSTLTTDAADEVAAFIVQAPKTGSIRGVWFRVQVGTGADRTIGIYQVDATTGMPSAPPTIWAANTNVVKTIGSGDNGDFIYSGNFTADASVTKGDVFAVCFIAPAASAGNILFSLFSDTPGLQFPYPALYTASWAKSSNSPNVLLEYSDGTVAIPHGCYAIGDASGNTISTRTFNNTSTPDVRGARFRLPGPVRVNGCWVWADPDGDFDVKLVTADWNGASTGLLASKSIDKDITNNLSGGILFVDFDTTVELDASTYYRLVLEPTSATNFSMYEWHVVDADCFGAQPLGGEFHSTSAKDPNDDTDFTDYDNATDGYMIPFLGLCIDGIDDGAGGGGGGGGGPLIGGRIVR